MCSQSFKPALFIYFDGSFKKINNKTVGSIGFYIEEQGGPILYEHKQILNNIKTNTEAEYKSLHLALKTVGDKYGYNQRLFIFGDEKTIINIFKNNIKPGNKYDEIINSIYILKNKFNSVIFTNITQSENKKAHYLSNSIINNNLNT